MKSRWIILSCGIVCFAACDSGIKTALHSTPAKADSAPVHFLLEAEDCEVLGEKAEDGKASGGAFVERQSGNYQPVFRCEIPASGKPLTVWLRRKGGAVQVKRTGSEEQKESDWVHKSQEDFIWTSFGEIPPSAEVRQLTAIGNNKGDETVSIDCVLFTEEPVEDKNALLTPLPTVSIDPTKTTASFRSAPALWGLNLYSGGDPMSLADPGYIENMAYLAPHMVRVHNAGKMEDSGKSRHGMLDTKAHGWDEKKVRIAIVGLLEMEYAGEIFLNIPNWPEWMDADKDGFLDDDKAVEYVDLVGRFAEIVWEFPEARKRVLFEVTSERDKLYHENLVDAKKPHRVAELARIFIQCSLRIRKVAPGARVGGPP